MEKEYCPYCGTKLIKKELKNEGLIPFCTKCNDYRFELYSVAVSMIIITKDFKETLLVKQYNKDYYRFVAGYINKGESAQDAVIREMEEEIGIKPIKVLLLKTSYFEKTETLMLNHLAIVDTKDLNANEEIDSYKWFSIDEGLNNLRDTSLAKIFYQYFLDNKDKILNNL